MTPTLPADTPRPIMQAATAKSGMLPVIDITHPSFALPDDDEAIAALFAEYEASERRQEKLPAFVTRCMYKLAARRAPLLRSLLNADAGFLDGLSTYVLKLGPDNLPPLFNNDIDRKVAASPHAVAVRLRLQQIARLMAHALQAELDAAPNVPLRLINIGGGSAIDSLNALLLLRRSASASLATRSVTITVLDRDQDGPRFGANALKALSSNDGPLAGLNVQLVHEAYDWNVTDRLEAVVRDAKASGGIVAASTEGALFEYGTDDAVVANLAALRRAAGAKIAIAGSVTRDDATRRRSIATTGFKLMPRSLEAFATLAARAGFAVERVERTPVSNQVLLRAD
ncbi:hypothetical protein [Paraburkholderia phosphatilytica]|uniref:hypothetical protein n=1 Tax=Paraburkholderia phosphatilytica TaxID=2282883 RepID=UPI000E555011|nr:hypothetical protein [Paraburkholderia phosphatilytica]